MPFLFSKDDSSLSDIYNSYVEYTKNEENVYRENVLFLLDEKGEKLENACHAEMKFKIPCDKIFTNNSIIRMKK